MLKEEKGLLALFVMKSKLFFKPRFKNLCINGIVKQMTHKDNLRNTQRNDIKEVMETYD